jgi:hypothetical protein
MREKREGVGRKRLNKIGKEPDVGTDLWIY